MMIRSLAIAGFALFTTVPIGARHAGPAMAAPAASTVSHPAPMCGGLFEIEEDPGFGQSAGGHAPRRNSHLTQLL